MNRPLLADHFLALNKIHPVPGPGEKRTRREYLFPQDTDLRALQARIRRAERMVFDAQAIARVGQVIHDIPELLIEQIQFARAPFDLCWVEYPWKPMIDSIAGLDFGEMTVDTIAFLIDHNRTNTFYRTAKRGQLGMMSWAYHLNTEWPIEDQLRFCDFAGVTLPGIDRWLWGNTALDFIEKGKEDRLRILRDTIMIEPLMKEKERAKIVFREHRVGDCKNMVAILLMLNQPRVTQYHYVARGRGWVGNKPKPFLEHHTIEVSLDAKARLISHSEHGGELRRRHKVMGHYCHDSIARDYARIAGCIHDWMPMTEDWEPWPDAPLDEREHWKCDACGGKRWWRVAHERGSEKSGFIEHDYNVTI